jgi:hypothetical protein
MCILINGDDDIFRVRRVVEMIGFHRREERVRILIAIYVQKIRETPSDLHILHEGNVQCSAVPAWPFQKHPDEFLANHQKSMFSYIYEAAFKKEEGVVKQVQGLTAYDSWLPLSKHESVNFWPSLDAFDSKRSIPVQRVESVHATRPPMDCPETDFVPFSIWRLGPLKEMGPYLIALNLEFSGETFDRLVGSQSTFAVEGPRRLLQSLQFCTLAKLPRQVAAEWEHKLNPFSHYLPAGEGYDVILLGPPFADPVEPQCLAGMMQAPVQIKTEGRNPFSKVRRFITGNLDFFLNLKFKRQATSPSRRKLRKMHPALV